MTITDIAAWYAAAVATMVLVWDFLKWSRGEPRLRVSARGNICYPDGVVIETRELEGGGDAAVLADYCQIEIVNVGGRPTTLIAIEATHHRKRDKMRISAHRGRRFRLNVDGISA